MNLQVLKGLAVADDRFATLALPIGAIYAALASFRWFWRWSLNAPNSGNPRSD